MYKKFHGSIILNAEGIPLLLGGKQAVDGAYQWQSDSSSLGNALEWKTAENNALATLLGMEYSSGKWMYTKLIGASDYYFTCQARVGMDLLRMSLTFSETSNNT